MRPRYGVLPPPRPRLALTRRLPRAAAAASVRAGQTASAARGGAIPTAGGAVAVLDGLRLREPRDHRVYCMLTLAVLLCACPWYRGAGEQDALVGGMPGWVVLSLSLTVLLAAMVSYAHLRLWDDAALRHSATMTAAPAPGAAPEAPAAAAAPDSPGATPRVGRHTRSGREARFMEVLSVQHAL